MHVAILSFFASSKGVEEERDEGKKILQHVFSLPFAKTEKVETIKQEVKHLRILMEDLKKRNEQFKAKVKEKDKQLKELNRQDINNIDQHHRGWMRVISFSSVSCVILASVVQYCQMYSHL